MTERLHLSAAGLSLLQRIDSVCEQFELDWQATRETPPQLTNYLAENSEPHHEILLRELIRIDLHYRRLRGETPSVHDYLPRFPALTTEWWEEVCSEWNPGRDAVAGADAAARESAEVGSGRASTTAEPQPTDTSQNNLAATRDWQRRLAGRDRGTLSGTVIAGHRLLHELGRGGMGVVYAAQHLQLKRTVAWKMIRSGDLADRGELERFRIEAEAAARLQHPHIVQVYEVGACRLPGSPVPAPFLSSEFMAGGSLAARLGKSPQAPREAAELVAVLARASHHAHERGIVHRDLKPANVLLTAEGLPKITDFGLAKRLDVDDGQTRTGMIVGTPSYMSPEQAAGDTRRIGPAADIYALGAILYEALVGHPPFRGETVPLTLELVRTQDPVPPRRSQPRIPRDLETICLKALHKSPEKRYSTAVAFAEDLERFLHGEPILARPVRSWEHAARWIRRHPAAATALLALGLGLLGAASAGSWYRRESQRSQALAAVAALESADLEEVPRLIQNLATYHDWALPELRRRELTADQPQARLHASLALPLEPDRVERLRQALLDAPDPRAWRVIRNRLQQGNPNWVLPLESLVLNPATPRERWLRAAATLASCRAEFTGWKQVSQRLVAELIDSNPLWLFDWTEAFQPIRRELVPELESLLKSHQGGANARALAVVLAEYCKDDPEALAKYLPYSADAQFEEFLQRLQQHPDKAVPILRQALQAPLPPTPWESSSPSPTWSDPPAGAVRTLQESAGLLTAEFALCQSLPLDRFVPLAETLRPAGYRPLRFRPYTSGTEVLVAALWHRDGRDWRIVTEGSSAQIANRHAELRAAGFAGCDVAAYLKAGPFGGRPTIRFAALWEPSDGERDVTTLVLGNPSADFESLNLSQSKSCLALHQIADSTGKPRYSSVWRERPWNCFWQWSVNDSAAARLEYPDPQLDVCLVANPSRQNAEDTVEPFPVRLWNDRSDRESQEVISRNREELLQQAKRLAAEGCRPIGISVLHPQPATWLAATVWQRPTPPATAKPEQARRQSRTAIALARFGHPDEARRWLRAAPDPSARTELIHLLATLRVPAAVLVEWLADSTDPAERRAVLLALGQYGKNAVSRQVAEQVADQLERDLREHGDPGVHAAARWVLLRWEALERVQRAESQLAGVPPEPTRGWFVRRGGETFTILAGPAQFLMGSPAAETNRLASEFAHWRAIPRTFALAQTEVTIASYEAFRQDHPEIPRPVPLDEREDPHQPVAQITWFEAAQYCRWLSEQDGFPESEMCYPPVPEIKEGMRLPTDYLQRTGYRLPTEAEWEYAARAGVSASRSFGSLDEPLDYFAWSLHNSGYARHAVGTREPNDWGLFDTYGNAWEWCQSVYGPYPRERGTVVTDVEDQELAVAGDVPRSVRGGSHAHPPAVLRSAYRNRQKPNLPGNSIGLRVARTLRWNPESAQSSSPPQSSSSNSASPDSPAQNQPRNQE